MTTRDSTASRFGGWWRRMITGEVPKAAQPAEHVRKSVIGVAAVPARRTQDQPVVEDPAWQEHHPEFAAYARALGLPYAALPPTAASEVEALTSAVLEASAADASDPSSLPTGSLQVLQLVAKPNIELSELAAVIQREPAFTAALLRVANSAGMTAATGPIRTVRDAITRLGLSESGRVIGVVATQSMFNPQSQLAQRMFGARLREIFVSSATAASGAAQLSMERNVGRSDLAFIGGMLHDVGKPLALAALVQLVLARRIPETLPDDVLGALLERVHVELGREALARWELPEYLVQLCAAHHDASCPLNDTTRELHLVRVASGLIALRTRPQLPQRIAELTDSFRALQITPLQARALDTSLRDRGVQMRQLLAL